MHHGQVAGRVRTHHGALIALAIEVYHQRLGVFYYVVVGEDVALGVIDHAAAHTFALGSSHIDGSDRGQALGCHHLGGRGVLLVGGDVYRRTSLGRRGGLRGGGHQAGHAKPKAGDEQSAQQAAQKTRQKARALFGSRLRRRLARKVLGAARILWRLHRRHRRHWSLRLALRKAGAYGRQLRSGNLRLALGARQARRGLRPLVARGGLKQRIGLCPVTQMERRLRRCRVRRPRLSRLCGYGLRRVGVLHRGHRRLWRFWLRCGRLWHRHSKLDGCILSIRDLRLGRGILRRIFWVQGILIFRGHGQTFPLR